MRFIGGVMPRDVAWRILATVAGSWAVLGYGFFSVIEKESGRWIGRLGPWRPGGEAGDWPGNEIGWGLMRAGQGKGYALEGASAAMDWAFDALGWTDVIHCIDPENKASIALAARLGSTRLRTARCPAPVNADIDIYGQTRAQWKTRPR